MTTQTATEFARKLGITSSRLRQLVAEGRIYPKPQRRALSERRFIYLFSARARKVGKDGKPGRKKGEPKKCLRK